jgi:hypothetical protein
MRPDKRSAIPGGNGVKTPIMTKEQKVIMLQEKKIVPEQELKEKIKQDLLKRVSGKDRDKIEFLLKRL